MERINGIADEIIKPFVKSVSIRLEDFTLKTGAAWSVKKIILFDEH